MELSARELKFTDFAAAVDYYYEQRWTDGLPVIPPTPEKVREVLRAVDLMPTQIVGQLKERNCVFTAEKVAINAVMAGCLPAYGPVIFAAVSALCKPEFLLHGVTASTGGAGILLVVNGPLARELNINAGENYFSPTFRANATIARAIRLLLLNVGGNRRFDRTTMGHAGKVMCVAEQEGDFWEPLHVQRGFDPGDSTVTVFAAEGPNQIQHHFATRPEEILLTFADRMSGLGTFNISRDTQCVLVVCPEHYAIFKRWGWRKTDVQNFLFRHARRPLVDLLEVGLLDKASLATGQEEATVVSRPENILLLTGGGKAGSFSAFLPGWGSLAQSRAVTEKIALECSGAG